MNATKINTISEFDALVAQEWAHVCMSYDMHEARDTGQKFVWPDYDLKEARALVVRALEARGEYRAYLLDRANDALMTNSNDAHTGGLFVII